jgi:predicted MPP superfamily phosphohydrolase
LAESYPPQSKADPLEHTLLHRLLVNSNRLQELPPAAIIVTLLINSALVAAGWLGGRVMVAVWVTLIFLLACAVDWWLLRTLRTSGRSYGPEKPVILALAAVQALLLVALGLIGAPAWLALLALIGITAIVYYSTWIEPFRLGVTHQTYITPKLKPDAKPIRLLQIGDMHVERITDRERHLNRLIVELQPDIIIYTGDFVNLSNTHDPESEKHIRGIIGAWYAPLGIYCVSGTPLVEPIERVEAFTNGLDNLKLLKNQWITVETPGGPLNILGLIVTHDMERDRALLRKMMLSASKTGLRLLNFHPPDIAPEANELGIDLYLCGHTHGGQIRLPLIGALFSSSHLGNQFIMGRYELGTTTLYTSRGVGLEGLGAPRARFLCPPEIVLWEIKGS